MKIEKLKKKKRRKSVYLHNKSRNVTQKYVFRTSKMAPNALPRKCTDKMTFWLRIQGEMQ